MVLIRKMSLAAVLGLLLCPIGPRAFGGFVTYTASTPTKQTTDFSTTLSVAGFDTSLGTLSSVTLSVSDNAYMLGTLLNKSASARDFSISEDVKFNVSFGQSQLLSNDLTASRTYSAVGVGQTVTFGQYSLNGSTGLVTFLSPSLLAALTSNSPVNFAFSTLTNTTVDGNGGNASTSFTTTADATLTVTYNYITNNITVVPEPASLVMTALGGLLVAGAGYARGRRRLA